MKRAVGYVRVSTEEQAKEGISLEAQKAKIRLWAEANDYHLEIIHEDAGISGGKMGNRPALQQAIGDTKPGNALVVYSLSRLARSTRDAINISDALDKANADLVSLTEKIDTTTASGKMIFRMMAVLAEFERDQISERVKGAMAYLKTQNKRVGGIPYGFDLAKDGETLTANQKEQNGIILMRKLRNKGLSLRDTIRVLEKSKIVPKSGGGWHPKVIREILRRDQEPKESA